MSVDNSIFKSRYGFAMSAFSRMYGVQSTNDSPRIRKFCKEWAESEHKTPEGNLTDVDFYFKNLLDCFDY